MDVTYIGKRSPCAGPMANKKEKQTFDAQEVAEPIIDVG